MAGIGIRGIGYDLFGTLVINTNEESRRRFNARASGIHDYLSSNGYKIPEEDIENALFLTFDLQMKMARKQLKELSIDEQLNALISNLGLNDMKLKKDLETPYTEATLKAMPLLINGAKETLVKLRNFDLMLGIITNTGQVSGEVLDKVLKHYGIYDLFKVRIYSEQEGLIKPHLNLFEKMREKMSLPSGQILFVGDEYDSDCAGAINAGMNPILYIPPYATDIPRSVDVPVIRSHEEIFPYLR